MAVTPNFTKKNKTRESDAGIAGFCQYQYLVGLRVGLLNLPDKKTGLIDKDRKVW